MDNLYNPFEEMIFTYDRCFICGEVLNSANRSDEHVFPRWLQREFNLWDQRLILLNGTEIPYRQLTIPCCRTCNNDHLNKKIEKVMESAVKGGYEEFIKLDESIIFKWLVKLSYGILFKELSLKANIRDMSSNTIIEPGHLEEFKMLFTLLQTIRFETEFINNNPWSILVFKIRDDENPRVYDAQDLILINCYFMRLNDIGIIANLQDGGYQKDFFIEHMRAFLNLTLHPIQFREMCAKFFYKSTLYKKTPFFIIKLPNNSTDKMQIVSNGISGIAFKDWSQKEYAKILEFFWKPWGLKFDDIYKDDNHVWTYLYNEDHSIKNMF